MLINVLLVFQVDSEWRTYFDFLPRDFQTPLQWNETELLLLQATCRQYISNMQC